MKITWLIVAFTFLSLIVIGIGWVVFFREKNIVDRPRGGENIIAFGDSLVEGVGALEGNDMISVLASRIGRSILNKGKSRDTTHGALSRLEKDVLLSNPAVVIVLLGGNDALSQVPSQETFRNLGFIIDKIHERGAGVLLLGIRGGVLGDRYKEEFKRLAKAKKVSYIPNILEGVFGNAQLMSDEIHPNDKGYLKMAELIEPLLREMLE